MIQRMSPGLDMCYTYPAIDITTAGNDLDDVYVNGLSADDISVRCEHK